MKDFKLILLMTLCLVTSCRHEELRHDMIQTSDHAIKLAAAEYEVSTTRSPITETETGRMFLGMAGKDSLFITATESPIEIEDASSNMTKSGGTEVPQSFHVIAFRDDEQSPYVDLKVTSSDSWSTYSPMLYWPVEYGNIHFFAYSYNLGNNHISPELSTSGGFSAEFDYVIPHSTTSENDAEVQPDIIFAISPSQVETEDPVEMNFVHALSAIEFNIGDIGDATVVSSTAQLSDILFDGHCTITHPVTAESIIWTTTEERNSYTQTIKDGVPFMIIPQVLSGTDVSFHMSVTIGDLTHEFPAKKFSGITDGWKPNRKYTYTITKGGEVKVDVRDSNTNTVKNNVKIQNSGFTTSYIRAAIVGYWSVTKDGVEEIASSWDINDEEVGTLTKATDWDTHWKLKDGIYYHKSPVAPGAYTAPLFDRYELNKTTGPVPGSKLNISIVVQAIEKEEAATYWPFDEL